MTAGGNVNIYPGYESQPKVNLLMVKPLFNNVILLTSEVRLMTIDIKNMYLIMSNMIDCECMHIPVELIQPKIMKKYKLENMMYTNYI